MEHYVSFKPKENIMTTKTKLATAALTGLLTAGLLAATPAFAGEHDKGSCSGKNGCKGKAGAEKSECKGKNSCEGKDKMADDKDGEKAACAGKSGCAGKEEKKQ
jgi:hypothetical protein